MFNKKKEITILTNEIPVHILKNFLLSFPSNIPKYFKDIPKAFFDNQKRRVRSSTTIRTCSGFINLTSKGHPDYFQAFHERGVAEFFKEDSIDACIDWNYAAENGHLESIRLIQKNCNVYSKTQE